MAVVLTNKNKFKEDVLEQKGLVFVDFYADWCTPCKITEPIIEEISNEKKDIKFLKVNVDENPDISSQYNIFSIPTFTIFKDGKPVSQFVGAMGKENFLSEIDKAVNS